MRHRKLTLIGLSIALLLTSSQTFSQENTSSWSDVDKLINQTIQPLIDSGAHHSIEVGVLRSQGTQYYSFAKSGKDSPNERSFFGINSMTKVFTGLGLAQMVTEGKISLDATAESYLPGKVIAWFNGSPITIRSLVTQSSGLADIPTNLVSLNPYDDYAGYTDDLMFSFLKSAQLSFQPGTSYQYSNVGFGLLGYLLAQVDHKTYPKMIQDRMLTPLELSDTRPFVDESMKGRLEYGHDLKGNPVPPRSSNEGMDGSWILRSTASDMIRFLNFQLHPESTAFPNALQLSQIASKIQSGAKSFVAFAWNVRNDTQTHEKDGAGGGYSSVMYFNRNRQTGLVILSSSDPTGQSETVDTAGWNIFTYLR